MSPTYRRFGSPLEKSFSIRSEKRRADWSGIVVFTRRRNRIPASSCSRLTRATRLWFTRSAGAAPPLSSAVILGAP